MFCFYSLTFKYAIRSTGTEGNGVTEDTGGRGACWQLIKMEPLLLSAAFLQPRKPRTPYWEVAVTSMSLGRGCQQHMRRLVKRAPNPQVHMDPRNLQCLQVLQSSGTPCPEISAPVFPQLVQSYKIKHLEGLMQTSFHDTPSGVGSCWSQRALTLSRMSQSLDKNVSM